MNKVISSVGRSLDRPSLDEVARRIDQISTLPHVALRVMEVASNPDAGPGDLKRAMECDAALCAKVLRCVNSAAYGLRTKVTNLQQAIAYLGMKQVRNLAMAAQIADLFKSDEAIGPYRRSALWRHLVSVGVCGRLIAMRIRLAAFEDVFLAGLLHDIGIILEDQHVHREFVRVLESLDGSRPWIQVEQEHLGFDHTTLGLRLAEQWRFPEGARAAIRYHHASELYRGDARVILLCVEVANAICTLKGITSVGIKAARLSRGVLEELSLTKEDLVVIAQDLDRELAENATLLDIGNHGNPRHGA